MQINQLFINVLRGIQLNKVAPAISLLFALLISPIIGHADTTLVILEEKSAYQKKFLTLLKTAENNPTDTKVISVFLNDFSKKVILEKQPSVIVSLNKKTSKKLINLGLKIPTIHTLLTQSDVNLLASCIPDCRKLLPFDRFLVLDQPALRQLDLIRHIKPSAKKIGVFYTEKSSLSLSLVKQAATSHPVIISEHATKASSLGFQLNEVARASDIILALADTDIYNTSTLPQILLTSYRHHTPVLGFSRGFVKAGAISAVVSDIPQFVSQLSEILDIIHNEDFQSFNSLIYPKYFNVVSNRNVARSLHLNFPADAELTSILKFNEANR